MLFFYRCNFEQICCTGNDFFAAFLGKKKKSAYSEGRGYVLGNFIR